jgi:mono/diheme cytochrome c family protein
MTPKESNRSRSNRTALLGGLAWAVLVLLIPAVPLVTLAGPVAAADGGGSAPSQGEKVFADQKCSTCHDLSTMDVEAKVKEGSATHGGDLAGKVTDETDRDALASYLRGETERDGETHKKKVKMDDAEMKALLDWLATQEAD